MSAQLLSNEDLAGFHRDGFAVLRNAFSSDEVSKLRQEVDAQAQAAASCGRILKPLRGELIPLGDLCSLGPLSEVVFDTRILACARQLLSTETLAYFGDSSVMVGGQLRGFHKDNADRYDGSADDWNRTYELVRFGIYLDNHVSFSGGLKVRRGSHLVPDISTGELVDVASRPGDLVMWSLRITHSGAARRLKLTPFQPIHPRLEEKLPDALFRKAPERRLAIFMTLAKPGQHLNRYIAKHLDETTYKNNYLRLSWLHSVWNETHAKRAAHVGLTFQRPCDDYGSLADARYTSEGVQAGQLKGERAPAGRVERTFGRIKQAVERARETL